MVENTQKLLFPPSDLNFYGGYDTVFFLFCSIEISYFINFLKYSYAGGFAAAAADAAAPLLQPLTAAAAAAAATPAVATAASIESSTQLALDIDRF